MSDELEALTRRYCNEVVKILPLTSGRIAVFNRAGDLCGIVSNVTEVMSVWRPPAHRAHRPTLEEIGL